MSLGVIREPSVVFGDGKKNARRKARRLATIARWAMARRDLGDDEVKPGGLTMAKVRALRALVADASNLAEHCDVLLCRLKHTDAEVALAVSVVVDAINARVGSRDKET